MLELSPEALRALLDPATQMDHPVWKTLSALRERERLEDKARKAANENFDSVLDLNRRRGERIHQEVQDQLDRSDPWAEAAVARETRIATGQPEERPPTLQEMLGRYGHRGLFQWREGSQTFACIGKGLCWLPAHQPPGPWVPRHLADAWYREQALEAPLLATPAPGPAFDEPEGECRKSAESASKPRLELVPYDVIEEIAQVLTYGANKYEANNWTRGARWGRYFAAMLRHAFAWWRGEDKDPETGYSHLAHVGCNLVFLMSYQRHGWGEDDRFLGPDSKPFTKHDGSH